MHCSPCLFFYVRHSTVSCLVMMVTQWILLANKNHCDSDTAKWVLVNKHLCNLLIIQLIAMLEYFYSGTNSLPVSMANYKFVKAAFDRSKLVTVFCITGSAELKSNWQNYWDSCLQFRFHQNFSFKQWNHCISQHGGTKQIWLIIVIIILFAQLKIVTIW